MSLTKGEIATDAAAEIGVSGLTSKVSTKEMVRILSRLDLMISGWKQYHLCLGYVDSVDGVDPNQESGLNPNDVIAVVLNLAIAIAPGFRKVVPVETKALAKIAYEGIFSPDIEQREADPYQPKGSGNYYNYATSNFNREWNQFQVHNKNAPGDCGTLNIKIGQTKIYTIDLSGALSEGNTLGSYEYETGEGLSVLSISEADAIFTVECTPSVVGFAALTITLTMTPSGEVNPVTINFNITAT